MTRQELFEKHYADMHDLPVETMKQYRFASQDGYRLPGIAAAYRNFCAGWDAGLRAVIPDIGPTEVMRLEIPKGEKS